MSRMPVSHRRAVRKRVRQLRRKYYAEARDAGCGVVHAAMWSWFNAKPIAGHERAQVSQAIRRLGPPPPGSLPKLPQDAFNLERKRRR